MDLSWLESDPWPVLPDLTGSIFIVKVFQSPIDLSELIIMAAKPLLDVPDLLSQIHLLDTQSLNCNKCTHNSNVHLNCLL